MIVPKRACGREAGLEPTSGAVSPSDLPPTLELPPSLDLQTVQQRLRGLPQEILALLEAMPVSVILLDDKGMVLAANEIAAFSLNTPLRDLVGVPLEAFLPREIGTLFRQHAEHAVKTGRSVEFEHAQGDHQFRKCLRPILDRYGQCLSVALFDRDLTEHRRTEKALRESLAQLEAERNRWQITIESMADAVVVCDASGRLTFFNPAYAQLSGKTAAPSLEPEFHPGFYQLYHPNGQLYAARDLPLPRALDRGEVVRNVEVVIRSVNGSEHTLIWSAAPFRSASGGLLGAVAVARDITELKEAEARLARSNLELERVIHQRTSELAERAALLELSSDAIIVRDAQDRVTYWNRGAEEMYGWRRAEVLGLITHTFLETEFHEPWTSIQEKLHQEGRWAGELVHTRRDGTRLTVATRWCIQLDPSGQLEAILESNTDITERKRTELELRRREQELTAFFDESPLGLLWVDPNGCVLRANQATFELLGCGGSGLQGRSLSEFDADVGGTAHVLRRLGKAETISGERVRFWQSEGRLKHVLIDANGYWENGQLLYSRWFVRDITRRIELEQEILAISEREQRRIGQDLHDDLCQQLTGIEFLSQTLASALSQTSKADAEKAREIAAMVRFAMVQTRDLARGLSPLALEADGLTTALQDLAARTQKLFGKACRFVCERPVRAHSQTAGVHLYRIAQEAVSNAVKHSHGQEIEIRLSAAAKGFKLEVLDDGIGMPDLPASDQGMGLRIMQYRAETIGASLLVRPGMSGRGTCVQCEVGDMQQRLRERSEHGD